MSRELSSPALVQGFRTLVDLSRTRNGHVMLIATISLLSIAPALSYNGFCFSERRFWSDEEFINVAISKIISVQTHTITTRGRGIITLKPVRVVSYNDVEQFRQLNPDCCKIVPLNFGMQYVPVSIRDRLFGRAAKGVFLTYKLNYLDEDGSPQSTMSNAQVVVGNCGSVFD